MSYDHHDMFRDRLNALPVGAGRRGIAAMVMVEIVRWMPREDSRCGKTADELADLLNLRPGDVMIALRTLESLGVIDQIAEGSTTAIRLRPMTAGKAPDKLREEIAGAIACHAAWKRRLRHAIDTGSSEMTAEDVANDHLCEFGQWLDGPEFSATARDGEYEVVRHLHAQFHRIAAATLQLAIAGKKKDAERCMSVGGIFTETSSRLTKALAVWKRQLPS